MGINLNSKQVAIKRSLPKWALVVQRGLKNRAAITTMVKGSDGRNLEPFMLLSIIEGNGAMALVQLEKLVIQGRIDSNMERRIKEFINELVIGTAP